MKRLLVASAASALLLAPGGLSASSSLTPNFDPATVRYGATVTFTAVYPKEATRSVTTVQHERPALLPVERPGLLADRLLPDRAQERRRDDHRQLGPARARRRDARRHVERRRRLLLRNALLLLEGQERQPRRAHARDVRLRRPGLGSRRGRQRLPQPRQPPLVAPTLRASDFAVQA